MDISKHLTKTSASTQQWHQQVHTNYISKHSTRTSASTQQRHQQALNKDISKHSTRTSANTQQRHQHFCDKHACVDHSYLLILFLIIEIVVKILSCFVNSEYICISLDYLVQHQDAQDVITIGLVVFTVYMKPQYWYKRAFMLLYNVPN